MELNQVGTIKEQNIDIIEYNGRFYALYGWNGEEYTECWEVKDKNGIEIEGKSRFNIKPVYDWKNCPKDEDGEYDTDELKQIDWNIEEV